MNMMTLRRAYLPACTIGELYAGEQRFFTVERPWLDNRPFVSCIPEGVYALSPWSSRKHPLAWRLDDVPQRSDILIHAGNRVDDVHGCIAPGMDLNQKSYVVHDSRRALRMLAEIMEKQPITHIRITVNQPQYP